MAVVGKTSFQVVNENRNKGPLVKVEISEGRFVKMYRADAEAQRLIEKQQPAPQDKSRKPAEDKRRKPKGDKTLPQSPPGSEEEADDLTEIDGVGKATARALQLAGIETFAQLKTADVSRVISGNALTAIEEWRSQQG